MLVHRKHNSFREDLLYQSPLYVITQHKMFYLVSTNDTYIAAVGTLGNDEFYAMLTLLPSHNAADCLPPISGDV